MHRVVRASTVRCLSRPQLNQIRTNSTNARLATEFNGLVLPTQQELRENVAEENPSRPPRDRTIEQRRKARMAREAAMTPKGQREPTNSTDATVKPGIANQLNGLDILSQELRSQTNAADGGASDRTATRRRDSTIEQRRAARLAREAEMTANGVVKTRLASEFNGLALPGQENATVTHQQPQQDLPIGQRWEASRFTNRPQSVSVPSEGEYGDHSARSRRRRSERLESLDVLGEFTVHTKTPKPKFNKRRDQGSQPDGSAYAASPRTMTRVKHRSPNSQPTVVAESWSTNSPLDANAKSEEYACFVLLDKEGKREEIEGYEDEEGYEENEGYEEDEEYEDEEYEEDEEDYRAELNDPEHLSDDLADVFGPKWTPKELVGALKIQSTGGIAPPLTRRHTQYMLETLGGDYMRHSPGPAHVSLTSPEQNDAVTQAQLVLSKIKMIDLNQKQTLLEIVHSSVQKQSKALKV